jgi:hypothetical protein
MHLAALILAALILAASTLFGCAVDPAATEAPTPAPVSRAEPDGRLAEDGSLQGNNPAATPTATGSVSPPPAPATGDGASLDRATGAAKMLGKTLLTRVQASMGADGPVATVSVCADEAQALTAKIGLETGVTVGRSSLRLRNPANAGPPWVQTWLTELGERPASGVAPLRRIDHTPDGPVARVALPLSVAPPCLACHGPVDALNADVVAVLDERYPTDAARGYAVGDLRGVIWAETRVASSGPTAP